MAQLPPKIPNVTPNWQEFPHQKLPHTFMTVVANGSVNVNVNPSWVDEFLDFSSARRGAHRRSASDSIAFLEAPLLEHCRGAVAAVPDGGDFNRFEDDQIMSMFTDDISPSVVVPTISSARRGEHRQSASDSIAFPEAPLLEHCHGAMATVIDGGNFDRFEDDQFMSMFTDEISPSVVVLTISSSNPSSPSDRNGINEEKQETSPPAPQPEHHHPQPKNEPEEAHSPCKSDSQVTNAGDADNGAITPPAERIIDPKRVKRILANRQSAQRSRVRKLQYISELERNVNTLQAEVSVLSPRVAFLDHQRLLLNVDNSALKQRIAALAQDKIFKDAHQDALKREIERLRQVYHQQNMHKMDKGSNDDNNNEDATAGSPPPSSSDPSNPPQLEKEQVLNA